MECNINDSVEFPTPSGIFLKGTLINIEPKNIVIVEDEKGRIWKGEGELVFKSPSNSRD